MVVPARHRSHASYGIGDELRASFVTDGTYWGAAAFLRDGDQPWFTDDVRFLAQLAEPIANGLRRAVVHAAVTTDVIVAADSPWRGRVRREGPGRAHLIGSRELDRPDSRGPTARRASGVQEIQAVAARARSMEAGADPLQLAARSRVQTRSGAWLLLYGTLSGGAEGRSAVVLQPAPPNEVAPLVALSYGLSRRECQVVRLCLQGQATKQWPRP